ncbi:MAG: alpha/beta hydrolase [Clostridia bacterium]
MLFLHGFGGSKNSFLSSFEHLSMFFHCISLDFAGFGDNPEPQTAYSVTDYAVDVVNFLKNKGIDNIIVIAHSFGCRIALKLNYLCPNLISKMIITGGAGIKPRHGISYYYKVLKFKFAKKMVACNILKKEKLLKFGSSDYKSLSPIMKQTFINVVVEDLSCYAKLVKCKTLLFWGEYDCETPLYMAKRLNKYIKRSKLIIVKDKGHFAYLEEDILFKESIVDFLNERE